MSDLTPSKLDELRRLAAIAADATTERTPWYSVDDLLAHGIESEDDAHYIAALTPPTVLELRDAAENQDILIGSVNHYKADRDALATELTHMTEARDNARAEVDRLTAILDGRCLSDITHRDEEHRQSVCMLPEGHAPLMHDDCMGCTWTDADHWQQSAVDRADELEAAIERVRELAEHYAGLTNVDAASAILRALDEEADRD